MNKFKFIFFSCAFFIMLPIVPDLYGQYQEYKHKKLPAGVVPVSGPGSYDRPGTTYMLTQNISDMRSAVFLGKDVTLDLNGYTITYADGNYEHIPNYGFEEGLKGWNISNAPGARVVNTKDVHIFIGEKLLSLQAGDEVASQYINLPVPNRSYFAMCGLTGRYYHDMGGDMSKDMRISIYVDDENGREVRCFTKYRDTSLVSCPVENKSAHLGGGFIFAHLNGLPAGKYRIRVKANTNCLVDQIDIRPAMDVGIGIVEHTDPNGHYNHLYNRDHCAFFDYTEDVSKSKPFPSIPRVEGTGTVTIKNGSIKNGTVGILSWGIQSTAKDVKVILDNVNIVSSGINTTAVDVPWTTIVNCRFNITNPFIINRHGSEFYAVDIRNERASEVSFSEFYGGQGCLAIKGLNSSIHHNHFVNHQTVTNHYSIMAMGDGTKIFENRIEPEIGSGIEIYIHKNIEIFNNVFKIEAAPPSCEYADRYSTNAIRLADYGAQQGSTRACKDNRIYNNKFYITGKKYKDYPDYIPVANAIFYSASGGENWIFGNDIIVEQADPDTDANAFAFYIGNAIGGLFYNNQITSNVAPIWIACSYGSATDTKIYNNQITKVPDSLSQYKQVRMGSMEWDACVAKNIEFRSNNLEGSEFEVDATQQNHSYSVYWTITIHIKDKKDNPVKDTEVSILDNNGNEVLNQKTSTEGYVSSELMEYSVEGSVKTCFSPFTIIAGKKKTEVQLNKNSKLTLVIKQKVKKKL